MGWPALLAQMRRTGEPEDVVDGALLEELRAALMALALLVAATTAIYWLVVDLPLLPFFLGTLFGSVIGLGLLVLFMPRRRPR